MKDHLLNSLAPLSAVAAIASWQEQLEFWLRIAAAIVAIAAGVAAFVYHRAKTRQIQRQPIE